MNVFDTLKLTVSEIKPRLFALFPRPDRSILNLLTVHVLITFATVTFLALPIVFIKVGSLPPDSFSYLRLAHHLSYGQGYFVPYESPVSPESYGRAPLYATLFAIAFLINGVSVTSALWIAKIFAVGNVFLLFLLGNKLFDKRAGLLAAAITATSSYMTGFPAQLEIDQTLMFFVLTSLYLLIVGFDQKKSVIIMAAGLSLGLAFLVKEVAVLWTPLPIILLLNISRWRHWRNFKGLLGFGGGFGLVVGLWWLYYYWQTGNIFLLATRATMFSWLNIQLLMWGVVVSLIAGAGIIWGGYKLYTHLPPPILQKAQHYFFAISPWAVWLVTTTAFTLFLARSATWFSSPTEIPVRLLGFEYWWQQRVLPEHPLFNYWILIPAIIVVIVGGILKKQYGYQILLWMFLIFTPHTLTLAIEGQYVQATRYGMWLFYLGYLVLGIAIASLIEQLDWITPARFRQKMWRPTNLIFSLVIGYMAWTGWIIPDTYNYHQYSFPSHLNHDKVLEITDWIKSNIPVGANLAASRSLDIAIDFYTDANYNIHRWYNFGRDPYDQRLPFNVDSTLIRQPPDSMSLIDYNTPKRTFKHPLYIRYGMTTNVQQRGLETRTFYTNIDNEKVLTDFFRAAKINYFVIIQSPDARRYLDVMPAFFLDHPAFDTVYETDFTEDNKNFTISIIKIEQDKLEYINYPQIMSSNTWRELKKHGTLLLNSNLEGDDNINLLIQAVGPGPFYLQPTGAAENTSSYIEFANYYVATGNIDLAAFQYHLLLQDLPEQAPKLLATAQNLADRYPTSAGPSLLLGDIYYLQDDYNSAAEAYTTALQMNPDDPFVTGAVFQGLGKTNFIANNLQQTVQYLQQALDTTIFNSAQNRALLGTAQGEQLLAEGDHRQAVDALRQAIENNPTPVVEHYFEKTSFEQIGVAADTKDIAAYREAFTLAAQDQYTRDTLAEAFLTWGQQHANREPLAALKAYRHAYTVSPIEDTRSALLQAYLEIGGDSIEAELLDELLTASEAAIAESPDELNRYWDLAEIYQRLGRRDKAMALYLQTVEESPDNHVAHYRLARAYQAQGQVAEALEQYDRVLALQPDLEPVYQIKHSLYLRQKQSEQAVMVYEHAAAQNPTAAWPRLELGQWYLEQARR